MEEKKDKNEEILKKYIRPKKFTELTGPEMAFFLEQLRDEDYELIEKKITKTKFNVEIIINKTEHTKKMLKKYNLILDLLN